MKKLTAALMLMTILLSYSCEKSESDKYTTEFKSLLGDWIWQAKTGGIGGTVKTPASTGKEMVLTIMPDYRYSITIDGNLQGEWKYYTSYISDENAMEKYFIILSGPEFFSSYNWPHKKLFELNENSLIIKDEYADGYQYTYTRKR